MQLIPVQTKILKPPKDDLFVILDKCLKDVQEGDIVLVTSKVISIHQGACVPIGLIEKEVLVSQEEEHAMSANKSYPLRIKYNAFLFESGIDESNGEGYYVLLPKKPYEAAKEIWEYLRKRHSIKNVGVIITDSHLLPFRRGVTGISIAFWGFLPVAQHEGKRDLFGREILLSSTNIADSLASASAVVCGECDEATPVVIARDVPGIVYTEKDVREELLIPIESDLYGPLLKEFCGD